MRKIRAGDVISYCVHIGEVIKYNPGDGFYYEVVSVNKPKGERCTGCALKGYNCGVWLDGSGGHQISVCCTDAADVTSAAKFCKFVRVDGILEDL